jgi:YHS domain-containing protein
MNLQMKISDASGAPLTNEIKTFREASYLHLPLRVGTWGEVFLRGLFIWLMFLIKVSEKTMYKVARNGKTYYDAFLFVLTLRSFHHNPILFDFKGRISHYRRLTGMSDERFRKLLKAAHNAGLIALKGDHLHLYSFTKEKREYKARGRQEIALSELKPFFYYSILKQNIKQQVSKIKFKSSTVKNECGISEDVNNIAPYQFLKVNTDVTISVRSVAKLFDVCPSYANDILQGLKKHGLTIIQNIVHISKDTFKHCLAIGRPNIRYNKETRIYSYVKAQQASLAPFKTIVAPAKQLSTAFYNNQYW